MKKCFSCDGGGRAFNNCSKTMSGVCKFLKECEVCKGQGTIEHERDTCPPRECLHCDGTGVRPTQTIIHVDTDILAPPTSEPSSGCVTGCQPTSLMERERQRAANVALRKAKEQAKTQWEVLAATVCTLYDKGVTFKAISRRLQEDAERILGR